MAIAKLPRKGMKSLYETNVPGISYRLLLDQHAFPLIQHVHCSGPECHRTLSAGTRLTFQLVKTQPHIGNIASVNSGIYGVIKTDDTKPAVLVTLRNSVHLHPESCQFSNTNVNFGEIDISNNNERVLETKSFALNYQCASSGPALARWEGAETKEGFLTSEQIEKKGLAISISDAGGNQLKLNRIFKVNEESGKLSFNARLIKTGTLTEGDFNVVSTLHMIYP
ncbi:fimbrial protein [Enterobacter bugandensis]|uniref:fimbrial protein n=1 Tax=Enterobacter bugandensis TaxID=881260 RepID=UPI000B49F2EF|nr:fimbrial protein [Enterobacter bugandensis]QWZ48828.1 fimbrial protein [Enterobacter bugandensis]UBH41099.1 fimbrial protein [Enterobacter bugandensis]UBH92801.1 fimbrial protein [Enterobacter bugandensis]UBH99411.1 fimbrial protein [Enterobacter bugandensis]